ncbi:MAG: nuclear transport factor 2 family protein [Nitrosarchaeum sp.]
MTNKKLVKKFYNAFKNQDTQMYPQLCDEKMEWITLDGMPHGGRYVGLKAIFEDYFPHMLENFTEFHAIPETFLESNDHVVVIGRYSGTSKIGKKFDVPFSHIYQIKNNKIIKFRQFTDTEKIQESLNATYDSKLIENVDMESTDDEILDDFNKIKSSEASRMAQKG